VKSPRRLFLIAIILGCVLGVSAAPPLPALPNCPARVVVSKVNCASRVEAFARAVAYVAAHGGRVEITSGTPSMEPLIHGQTYTVVQDRPFAMIRKYDLLVYLGRPDASRPNRLMMLHRVVQGDRHGWIMSGDHNRWSESWDRVTPQTYFGTVVALFAFPAPAGAVNASGAATATVSAP